MLALIDESGCTGFKPYSSTHFVIGMIIFDTFKDAENAASIISRLKKEVGFKREFRFSSCNNRKRDLFFEAIKNACFTIRLLVVEKKLIYSLELQTKDDLFINYCLKNLMKDGAHRLNNAVIKVDGKGSKIFKKSCEAYLRKQMPPGTIKDIKFCDSKNDILIQLADMVVSAYSRPYNNANKADAFKWRNMIESKIENIWNFR